MPLTTSPNVMRFLEDIIKQHQQKIIWIGTTEVPGMNLTYFIFLRLMEPVKNIEIFIHILHKQNNFLQFYPQFIIATEVPILFISYF